MTALALGIVADDLSGAAECAAHALVRVSRSIVSLTPASSEPSDPVVGDDDGDVSVVTVDTDSRRLGPEDASRVVRP